MLGMNHVPYKGASTNALIAKTIRVAMSDIRPS